ncbi:MAG: potassium transporter TrkA [Chloroflexi bacterium]|nr:potassium transporter TrkA [Chloroflexota bacterium]
MENLTTNLIYISSFSIIALASKQIGLFFAQIRLPKITGYLFTGLVTGAFVLGFFPEDAVHQLHFVDNISLAFIAFAAGTELFLPELKGRFKSISWVTLSLVAITFSMVSVAVFFLADFIPFMEGMPTTSLIAVSIMAGAILVARSPSSAIAIVNELRAKGSFTQVILGVTVVMDVVVIALFALSAAVADALLTKVNINIGFVILLLVEFLLALAVAYGVFHILNRILATRSNRIMKIALILFVGYAVFSLSTFIREISHANLPFEILIEPLLICMVAGFMVVNYSKNRLEFNHLLHDAGPYIYIAFFTLTGASLKLDVLVSVWPIALALFAVRLISIIISSYVGGTLAGDPKEHNKFKWMGFVTQAGVALGLAKEVSGEFPAFGDAFATMIIAVVVLNEMVGPIFFKYAINRVGEAHLRGESAPFDGVRDALIFGVKAQSISLARQLKKHDWQVKLVCTNRERIEEVDISDIDIKLVDELNLETLRQLDAEHADAIISFLPNDISYQVFEIAYEHFGTETLVARLRDTSDFDRFNKLGVLVVEPQTATMGLLEHFVRSPVGTSILLGHDEDQDMIDQEICDPSVHGTALRDLRLPMDVLILSIQRDGHTLVSRGFTQLHLGDKLTMVGPREKLDEVTLRLGA